MTHPDGLVEGKKGKWFGEVEKRHSGVVYSVQNKGLVVSKILANWRRHT